MWMRDATHEWLDIGRNLSNTPANYIARIHLSNKFFASLGAVLGGTLTLITKLCSFEMV